MGIRSINVLAAGVAFILLSAPGSTVLANGHTNDFIPPIRPGDLSIKLEPVADGLTAPNWGTAAPGLRSHLFVTDQSGIMWGIDLHKEKAKGNRAFIFLDNVMRRLALPEAVAHWSLASLRGEARQDRRQDRHACPVRHLPDGRGRGAEGIGPGHPAADRRTTTKTGPSVGTGTVGCTITTGGVCLNDENKPQIGLSKMEHRAQHAGCVPEAVFRLPGTPAKW